MVVSGSQKMSRVQANACTLPGLNKFMRKRKIMSKSGYYLEIKNSGEVSCTRNPSSIYSVLLVLTIGPNFVAIVGKEANRYLAVDERGKIFTSSSERKECVFREFLGRNFYTLLRTCHSDTNGRGWYLSINNLGKIRAEKVAYSDEPQLHFIIKVAADDRKKENGERKTQEVEHVWKYREAERHFGSNSSDRSRNSSPASSSSRSEYGSPLGFYDPPNQARPASFSGRSAFVKPASRSETSRPLSFRSEYGSPLSFMGNSGHVSPTPSRRFDLASPVSFSGRSEYGTPLSFMGYASPVGSPSGRPDILSPVTFSGGSPFGSPVSFSGRSEYGTPLGFIGNMDVYASPLSSPVRSDFGRPVSQSEYGSPQSTPLSFMSNGGHVSTVQRHHEYGHASPITSPIRSEYGTPLSFMYTHGHASPANLPPIRSSNSASSESPLSDRSGSSLSGKESVTSFGKTTAL